MADSWFHEAVCREKRVLLPIICSLIRTEFEVTDRSVSSSLCRKAEQQTTAVPQTIFSGQCHCSIISVQIV